MELALVSPPVSKPCEPEPALLVLAGSLAGRGIKVRVFDANLSFHQAVLGGESLKGFAESLSGAGAVSAQRAAGKMGKTLADLRSPATYRNREGYRHALSTLTEGYRAAGRALGVTLTASDFQHGGLSPLSSADLAKVFAEPELLPTAPYLMETAEELLAGHPKVVGISLTYLSQALHAFALAGILKRQGYGGAVVLGGALVTSFAKRLQGDSELFGCFDAIVAGPGEEALYAFAKSGGVVPAPGVLSPRLGIREEEAKAAGEAVSFEIEGSGLPWPSYLSPGGILPVAASRGCYWSKCAFCPETVGEGQGYRAADVNSLAGRILAARDDGGPQNVHFTDNALSPAHLKGFAEAFKGRNLPWYGFSRLEKNLCEPGFMERLAEGGCTMLQLGIESASQRLLDAFNKGTTVELAGEIVKRASGAGIRVYGYFLFGMPTETEAEAASTIEWIRGHSEHLAFLNLSLMNLPRGGELTRQPEKFGVESLKPLDERNDLSLYLGYGGGDTLDRRFLRRLLAEARSDGAIKKLIANNPRGFTSNHAAFAPL